MWKYIAYALMIILFSVGQIYAQNQPGEEEIPYPEIPRVSAFEVYVKYKAGKALLLYGGGEKYSGRHIMGAINLDFQDHKLDEILPKIPKKEIELFTYCY